MGSTTFSTADVFAVPGRTERARPLRVILRSKLHGAMSVALALAVLLVGTTGASAQQPAIVLPDSSVVSGIVAMGAGTEQGNAAKGSPGGVVAAVPDAFSGALTTAIPLRLPPGTKSPVAQLSISYNSRRGNGPQGIGWLLELPQLTTAPGGGAGASSVQYVFQNGSESIELIRKSGEEYQARVERAFLRFYRHIAPDGKISWEVVTRQGVRLVLGRDDDSRFSLAGEAAPRAWLLNDATDPLGNRMAVSYAREASETLPLPQAIVFDNPSRPALLSRSFVLDYAKRPDAVGNALPGTNATLSLRLAAIHTMIGTAEYDTLSLRYEDRPFSATAAAASLLSEVSLRTAVPGAAPLRIASLRYGAAASGIETAELNTQPFAFGSIAEQCLFGNFSGAGRTDMICYQQGGWQKVDIAAAGIAAVALTGAPALDPNLNLKTQCLAGDFEGMGQSSIACYVRSKSAWTVMHLASATALASAEWPGPEPTGQCLVLDLNADGRSDLACQSGDVNAMGQWSVSLSTGKSWSTTTWGSGPIGGFQSPPRSLLPGVGVIVPPREPYAQAFCLTGDFNGDRRADIACYRNDLRKWDVALSTGAGWSLQQWDGPIPENEREATKKCLALDFDGNGRADIACASSTTDWTIALSFPSGPHTVAWPNGPTSAFAENCLVGDLNGDGKADFACNAAKSATWTLTLNTGAGWQPQEQPWVDLAGREARNACFSRESGLQKTEILCARTDGVYERVRSANAYPHLLRGIVGALGGRTSIEYGSSADTLEPRMPVAPVVTQIRNDNGAGLAVTTTLSYGHGLFNPLDRTFRGFREVTSRTTGHPQAEVSTTRREFFQGAAAENGGDAPWAGVPYLRGREKLREVLDSANQPISRQVFAYRAAGSAPYLSPLETVTTYACLSDCQLVQTDTFEVDDNGGVKAEARTHRGPSALADRRIERTFQNSTDGNLAGFPATETVMSVDRSRIVSETHFFYDESDDCKGKAGAPVPRQGLVTRIERLQDDGSSVSTQFAYDTVGNLACVRDARGHVTRFEVDPTTNFVIASRNALGQAKRYAYFDASPLQAGWFGQLRQIEGSDGIAVRTEYDTLRRPAAAYVNQRAEPFRKTVYSQLGDAANQAVTEIDALGLAKVTRFDGGGNTVETVAEMASALSVRSTERWLPGSARLAKSLPSFTGESPGAETRFAYDAIGRLSRIEHPNGRTSHICYVGLVEFKLDGTRVTRATVRASSGEVVEYAAFAGVTAADCAATRALVAPDLSLKPDKRILARRALRRDELGRIVEVRDGGRTVLSRSYDRLGRLRTDDDADRGRTTYEYDDAGNLALRRDATGRTVATRYDALDRPIALDTTMDNAVQHITLRYDDRGLRSVGKLTAIDSAGTTETLDYDDEGRPSTVSTASAGVALTLSKTFDAAGRVATIRYPDGMTLVYGYNGHFLRTITVGGKQLASFDRPSPLGQYQRAAFANGVVRELSFSGPGNAACPLPGFLPCTDTLKTANGTLISDRRLKFDNRARLIQLDDDRPGFARTSNRFYYDNADRLVAHATRPLESGWTGSALPSTDLTVFPAATVPDDFKAAEPGASWLSLQAYDPSGNITWSMRNGQYAYPAPEAPQPDALQSVLGQPFAYDAAGRARTALHISLDYDATGRVSAVSLGPSKSAFIFGGSGELRQYQLAGQPRRHVVSSEADCASPAKCRNAILAGAEVIGFVDEGKVAFTHRDLVGSVREVTDKAGNVGARVAYGAFGEMLVSAGGPLLRYRSYAGGQPLEGAELYRMGPRIYFPRVGRFLSPDPVLDLEALPFEANPYAYAFNRPTYYADPDGDFAWAIVAAAALIGGIQASQHGDNILEGALRGAVFGVFIAGGYAVIGATGVGAFGQGAIMAYSGAYGGAVEAAIWGGDPGQAAQAGAISALGGHLLGGMEVSVFGNANGLAGTANYVATSSLKGAALSAMYAAATGRDLGQSAAEGAKSGAMGALAASAVHHIGSFAATGKLPSWDPARRIYVYNTKDNWLGRSWPGFSLGNVVSSDAPNVGISSMPGKNTIDHEASHTWKQSTAFGPGWGYVGSHAVAGLASLVFADSSCWSAGLSACTHEANVLEMQGGWIGVPAD